MTFDKHGIMEEDLGPVLLVSWTEVMIKRDSWGNLYLQLYLTGSFSKLAIKYDTAL